MKISELGHDYDSSRYKRVASAKDRAFAELAKLLQGRGWAELKLREQYRGLELARVIAFPEDSRSLLPMARRIGLIED